MSIALPDGFVDTGFTTTIPYAGNIAMPLAPLGPIETNGAVAGIGGAGEWSLNNRSTRTPCGPPDKVAGRYRLDVFHPAIGSFQLVNVLYACSSPPHVMQAGPYAFLDSMGPFRLGMRFGLIGASDNPNFPNDYQVEFGLFWDENTLRVSSCAGQTIPTRYPVPGGGGAMWSTTVPTGMTPEQVTPQTLGWSADIFAMPGEFDANTVQIAFTGLSIAGKAVDTSELAGAIMFGTGGGAVDVKSGSFPVAEAENADAPYIFDYALGVTKFGAADIHAHVTDSYVVPVQVGKVPQSDYLETPFADEYVVWNVSWPTSLKVFTGAFTFSIQSAWASAQDPALALDDLALPMPFRAPRLYVAGEYQPVSLVIAEEVSIQRPDGLTPSQWVSSDTGALTVTEGATDTTFEVSAVGATALRTLGSDWKHRVGIFGTADPLFGIEEYERTKHRAGEDIWGWEQYGYGEIVITAPATGSLTLRVRGNYLSVSDPHTSGADREADYTATLNPFVAVYTIPVEEGANTVRLDWLFPASATVDGDAAGVPFYYGRVDDLQLSGFSEGTYTLSELALKGDGAAYLKLAWGKQVVRDDYSLPVLALNGAFNLGNIPDQPYKPDETGDYGGSPRYIQPLTGSGTGLTLDSQYCLRDFWGKLNNLEGLTALYSQSAHDAAMIDTYGTELVTAGNEPAHLLLPLVPYGSVPVGDTYTPPCSVVVGQAQITPGLSFAIVVNHPLWGALEALVTQDGGRAPAGVTIGARQVGGTTVEASGLTDSDGYVLVSPVPGVGTVEWGLVEG